MVKVVLMETLSDSLPSDLVHFTLQRRDPRAREPFDLMHSTQYVVPLQGRSLLAKNVKSTLLC